MSLTIVVLERRQSNPWFCSVFPVLFSVPFLYFVFHLGFSLVLPTTQKLVGFVVLSPVGVKEVGVAWLVTKEWGTKLACRAGA